MTADGWLQCLLVFAVIVVATKPLGLYMARVFEGERTLLSPMVRPVERALYAGFGVDETEEMHWRTYTLAMLMFALAGILFTYLLLRLQGHLPLNPQGVGGKEMTPDLSFNTASTLSTTTNWESYTPETTVSYFSNMFSLALGQFTAAATGIAVAIAIVRGFARKSATGIGNFWVDVTRCMLYILLPICLVYSLALVQQGVPQNFAYIKATGIEGGAQTIPQGAVASQEAIKMLGGNGGGVFNANSAHPYENPTPLADFLQLVSMLLIPAGLTYTFGRMVGNTRQGWALFAAMGMLFFAGFFVCYKYEAAGVRMQGRANLMTLASDTQTGGNMEGKETRFGIAASSLFATLTTDSGCGAANSMLDSFTPLGGLVPLANIMTGEVIFGGCGSGLFGMLMYVVIAVFIAGLMVGRTPEYLGKRIEQYEVKMAMLAVLVLAADILFFTAFSANVSLPPGGTALTFTDKQAPKEAGLPALARWNHVNNSSPSNYEGATYNNVNNNGAHGLSEILYAYSSTSGNNGSSLAGLSTNTPWYNATIGWASLIGRFLVIVPLLAMAGSLVKKKQIHQSAGTLPTDTPTFVILLVGVVLIVGALTFFPALALGPIAEHLQMLAGRTF